MMERDLPASVAEQARLDLAMAAEAAERSNRPRTLLYGAIVLLIVAAIYAVSGVTSRAAAMSRVSSARADADKLIRLVNEVKSAQAALAARGVDYNPRVGTELETIARRNGAEPATTIGEDRTASGAVANMNQKVYKARFVDQDPLNLLNFLNQAQSSPETAGVEITRLGIRPGSPDPTTGQIRWNLDADFARWERKR